MDDAIYGCMAVMSSRTTCMSTTKSVGCSTDYLGSIDRASMVIWNAMAKTYSNADCNRPSWRPSYEIGRAFSAKHLTPYRW